ncbi:hypothetical protein N0V88_003816 [Collariella sp. IMI 366227]|nr:hypothetical protein N0V88_003816 [Collariella sp. IMI 366227]
MTAAGETWDQGSMTAPSPFTIFQKAQEDESHPSFDNLLLLVFGAVLEVLASQLNADKLVDLGIIPIIFVIQTLVSYVVSKIVARCFGFGRRASNFVTAMGVFGNSNSLPISLVISLSQTLKGLHWDRIPGDNDDEVAARGILYLLVFQQLGQLVRWSWGYHVLLAPKFKYEEYKSPNDSEDDEHGGIWKVNAKPTPKAFTNLDDTEHVDQILSFPRIRSNTDDFEPPEGIKGYPLRMRRALRKAELKACNHLRATTHRIYTSLPHPLQVTLIKLQHITQRVYNFLWDFMNPPLWAMLIAVFVASVPSLQSLFFREGSFIKTSVTSAISSSAGVAVPLILVVLGANLARNTQVHEDEADPEEKQIATRLLVASLISRMLLPTLIMAPVLALFAKYVPVSILDDPIFVNIDWSP